MKSMSVRLLLFLAVGLLPRVLVAADDIVARVNGIAITSQDLSAEENRLIPQSMYHGGVSDEKRAAFREKALNNLIERELQYQDALASGMKPDSRQVKTQMDQIRGRFKTKKEYKAALEQAGITEEQLKAQIEKNVVVQSNIDKTVKAPAQMSDAALKDYYTNNVSKFKEPESVKLREVSTKDGKKAREIFAKLKAGEDFGNVAARMSEDNYRVMGGDVGYIHRGRVLPEVEKVAFNLQVGEMSGLIQANGYWFVLKAEDKKPELQLSFDEVKDKLKSELETKRSEELMDNWISNLRAKAKIEVFKSMQ